MSLAAALAGLALLLLPVRTRPYDRLVLALARDGRQGSSAGGRGRLAAVALVGVLCLLWLGPLVAFALAAVAGGGWQGIRMFLARKEIRRQERSFLEAVAALGAEVRAGRAPPAALAAAAATVEGRLAQVLRDAATGAAYGADAGKVLTGAGRVAVSAGLRSGLIRLGAAWTVSARSGAAWSEVIEQVEKDLRVEHRHRQRMAAELAGSRATAVLLAGLPVIGMLLGSSLGADPIHVLMHTRAGQIAFVAGVLLETAGVLWTARIVRSAQENS